MTITKKQLENINKLPEILNAKDLKAYLNIGINRAYDLMKSPAFPATKIGSRYFVTSTALTEWLQINEGRIFLI